MNGYDFEPICVHKTLPIINAVKLMNKQAMQVLLVVNKKRKLEGIVTDGDIRRAIINNISFSESVAKIMNTKPITMEAPPDKEKAIKMMKKYDIRHIPVLDREGKITGLLMWKDFFSNGDITVEKKPNIVVIMAGGKGSRLDVFTKILPKPLIPIGEKPIIEHVIDHFVKYGFQRFLLSLNYKAEMIKIYFSDGQKKGYLVDFVQENDFLGTAGALSLMREKLTETFLVSNCDILIDANMEQLLHYHLKHRNDATILGIVRNVEIPYGVLHTRQATLDRIVEKPEFHFVINSGVYVLEPQIVNLIEDNQPVDMPSLLMRAKERNFKVQIFPMTCTWFDIGQWSEYQRAIQHISTLVGTAL